MSRIALPPNNGSSIQTRIVDVVGGTTIPPMLLNSYSALSIPAYRRAMAFLADNLASFPRSVRKEGLKLDTPHPLDRLLKRRPNNVQNATTFWRTLFFHAAHTGNGYAWIVRDPKTLQPSAVYNLMPEDVVPFRWIPTGGSGPEQYYFYKPFGNGSASPAASNTVLPGMDMIHLQGLGYDGQRGGDPVSIHDRTLERAAMLENYSLQYLQKGTMLRGAIEVPASLDDEQLAKMRSILQRFKGGNGEDILILTDGGKLNNSTTTPQASQFIEQTSQAVKQIAQITGVPPEFLFEMTEAKYNQAIEQAGSNVVRYCLRPWIELAEDELTIKLLSEAEQDSGFTIKLNPDALLRGDVKTQTDTLTASVNAGIRTPNEAREVLDLPPNPDPDADKLKRSGDTSPQPAKTPAAPPQKNSAEQKSDKTDFSAFTPIVDAACARVDAKTEKAFSNAEKKTGQERTIWGNVFADEQRRYAVEALKPIADTLNQLGADPIDAEGTAERYAAAIRRRVAGAEPESLRKVLIPSVDMRTNE
jgi:HK97 family phage portal protein